MTSRFTRVAMLSDLESTVGAGPFAADRFPVPFRRFTEEAAALAFVYGDTDPPPSE